MTTILASEMKIGDYVQMEGRDEGFSTSIVKQIKDELVTLFRPYGVTADFTYTGGVICYTGVEEYQIHIDSHVPYILIRRQALK